MYLPAPQYFTEALAPSVIKAHELEGRFTERWSEFRRSLPRLEPGARDEWRARRATEAEFLTELLRELEEMGAEPAPPVTARQIALARSTLQRELSERYPHEQRCLELLNLSLASAVASYDRATIHSALMALGFHHYMSSDYSTAADYYKQALGFTSPHRHVSITMVPVLEWLGQCYAKDENTLPLAVEMFDWAARMQIGLPHLIEKQRCRLRQLGREVFEASLQLEPDATCRRIGEVVAGWMVLKQRGPAYAEAVLRGVTQAEVEGSRSWQRTFAELKKRGRIRRPRKRREPEG